MSTPSDPPHQPDAPAGRTWIARAGGALGHRNFRLVWFAALGSTVGTWMQKYAQSWLVFDLTRSEFYLGLDDFLSQLPIILFMLIGGVVADRYDRRRLLTASQYVQAVAAFALATLVLTDRITIGHILGLSFLAGCGQAFGGPAYQALIPSLVPRRDLPNAIALNSTQFNLSRVLGPVVGNEILIAIGTAACFAVNGASFFLVVVALAALRLPPAAAPAGPRPALVADLRAGLDYVRRERIMLTLTVLAFVTTFLAMPISTFLPVFARDVFVAGGETGAQTRLSTFMVSQGLGAITGALVVGSLGRFRHMGLALLGVQLGLGLLIAAFALSRSLPFSYGVLFLVGFSSMSVFSVSFSLVQLAVPDELRGRVVSIYMVALRGGWPLGSLVGGMLAAQWTAPVVLTGGGLALAVLSAGLFLSGRGRSLRGI